MPLHKAVRSSRIKKVKNGSTLVSVRLKNLCDQIQSSVKDFYSITSMEGRKALWAKNSPYLNLFKNIICFQVGGIHDFSHLLTWTWTEKEYANRNQNLSVFTNVSGWTFPSYLSESGSIPRDVNSTE